MKFAKMQGTGNDFVLVEAKGEEQEWSKLAVAVCDRHYGVGSDGLILVLPSRQADVGMRMFNPDGSESDMCGNGIRCLAKYAVERGLARPKDGRIGIETGAGVLAAELFGDGRHIQRVRITMGSPRFAPKEIPMAVEMAPPVKDFPLEIEGQRFSVTCLSMGNPHAVHFLGQAVEEFPLERVGPQVERHPAFPQRVNFEVARVISRDGVEVRVWERGAGMTLACGSGACAVTVAARIQGLVEDKVDIRLPGGMLQIEWDGQGDVYLTGPAEAVFEGEWKKGL